MVPSRRLARLDSLSNACSLARSLRTATRSASPSRRLGSWSGRRESAQSRFGRVGSVERGGVWGSEGSVTRSLHDSKAARPVPRAQVLRPHHDKRLTLEVSQTDAE